MGSQCSGCCNLERLDAISINTGRKKIRPDKVCHAVVTTQTHSMIQTCEIVKFRRMLPSLCRNSGANEGEIVALLA
jgi:hypothetical protein